MKYCGNCGREVDQSADFCYFCGQKLNDTPVAEVPQPSYEAPQPPYEAPQPPYEAPQPSYEAPQPPYNAPQPPYNAPQPPYSAPAQPEKPPANGLAIASLVLGIVAFFCFPIICAPLAIIFAGVAKSKGNYGKMATAGLILGIIGIVLWILSLIIMPGITSYLLNGSLR